MRQNRGHICPKFKTYLNRHVEVATLTYPDYFQWWQPATSAEQKATKAAGEDQEFSVQTCGRDDFANFLVAKQMKDDSQQQLAQLLSENEWQPDTLLTLIRCLQ